MGGSESAKIFGEILPSDYKCSKMEKYLNLSTMFRRSVSRNKKNI